MGCSQIKEDNEFHDNQLNKKYPVCKECCRKYARDSYARNKEHAGVVAAIYRRKNPERTWAHATISNHNRRGIKSSFSAKELMEYAKTITHCPYCGIELEFSIGNDKPLRKTPTLDRINNEDFMTMDNIQIICHTCNTGKGQMTHEEFLKYIDDVHKRCCHGN